MPTTSNFGWTTPADTDLVKDGALAIRTLGNGIDTSFLDLKGGTTGQNLRKASDTDLDFTFAGDATNTVIDAEGDLLVGDSADTLQRLAIGTTGQVLTVDTTLDGKIKWAAPAGGGKVLQVVSAVSTTSTTISTTTYTDANITATITPSSATSKILVLVSTKIWSNGTDKTSAKWKLVRGATAIFDRAGDGAHMWYSSASNNTIEFITNPSIIYLDSPSTTSATTYKIQGGLGSTGGNDVIFQRGSDPSSITLLEIGA